MAAEGKAAALGRLQAAPSCGAFFGPDNLGADTLNNTTYRFVPFPPQNRNAPAATPEGPNPRYHVFINVDQLFVNPRPGATIGFGDGSFSARFESGRETQGFIMLHELGHQTGAYGNDVDLRTNANNSKAVYNACYR